MREHQKIYINIQSLEGYGVTLDGYFELVQIVGYRPHYGVTFF